MADRTHVARCVVTSAGVLMSVLVLFASVGLSVGAAGATTTSSTTNASKSTTSSKPLTVPKTTVEQDSKFFADVTEADPALVTYEQKHGNVALEALLTAGSAFCALLKRGGGIDEALVEEAQGARSAESQTSLPLTVTTLNTIESAALLTLCRSEQKLVPASVRSKLRRLSNQLSKRAGSGAG
jgi:hypothetical protein